MTALSLPGIPDPGPSSPAGLRNGIAVARVTVIVGDHVHCGHCALGIAIDVVGQRHGEARHDWSGRSGGHVCKGVSAEAAAVLLRLFGWTA